MGHAPATLKRLDVAELLAWYTALTRETPTQAHEHALFARVRPGDTLMAADLAAVPTPTSFFWGPADTFGGAAVAQALTSRMPHAALDLLAGGGHIPWLNTPDHAAAHVRGGASLGEA
jgi:pimeloyl-ACP methyl ester carboxylesterase